MKPNNELYNEREGINEPMRKGQIQILWFSLPVEPRNANTKDLEAKKFIPR